MSDLIDKAKDLVGKHEDKKAQPGDGIENTADNTANSKIDQLTDQAGLGDKFDKPIDDVADQKINSDIPGGN